MSHAGFEIRPVRHYDAPRYPTTCLEAEPTEAEGDGRVHLRDVLRWLLCAVLMLGLAFGAIACGDRGRLAVPPPEHLDGGHSPDGGGPDGGGPDGLPPPDGGDPDGDILAGDIAECTPGDIYCQDGETLMTCEHYYYEPVDCTTYCPATYGPQSYSQGCDVNAADPCNCYDMLDGGIAMCTPDTVECIDPNTVSTCDEATGGWVTSDCTTWCTEHFGAGATATGCDATQPDNPCGCVIG